MARTRRTVSVLAALVFCALIALPAAPASAVPVPTFEVDSAADTPGAAACETPVPNMCTLRGAVEAANANADHNLITFDHSIFDGSAGGTEISLGSALEIKEPVTIEGGHCTTRLGENQTCGEVHAATAQNAFVVEAEETTIEGLAITGGANGIVVSEGTDHFTATNDWFGLRLESDLGGDISQAGILLEPEVEDALIGGTVATDRNVFSRAEVAVYIQGASHNQIEGNYIGALPDGTTFFGAAPEYGVRIVDTTTPVAKAEYNEIGGARTTASECDGACNVISTFRGLGVQLVGLTATGVAPTGPTTIRGNYLGLSPDGTGEISGTNEIGIEILPGSQSALPGEVDIGGADAATEGNFFVGGEYGVYAEEVEGLSLIGNHFGYDSHHGAIEDGGSTQAAIGVSSLGLASGALIFGNAINAESSGGIESYYAGSEIIGNQILGGAPAILTAEDTEGVGNVIASNRIEGPERFGILIENENDLNEVVGNTILNSSGVGIQLSGDPHKYAAHNRIGGDLAGEENVIDGSQESAIDIAGEPETNDEVAANSGTGNKGPFITLSAHSTGHPPNGEIHPPTLEVVRQSTATGTALPGAKIRIFSKGSTDAGELEPMIATATADPSGHWTASYAKLPVGRFVAATQTTAAETAEGATSEVSASKAAEADPVEPEKTDSSTGSQPPASPPISQPPPKSAPRVKITKGPKKSSTATTAKFKFRAEPAAGAKFQCKLDGGKWAKCTSPKTYKKLKPRKHTFQVRASANGRTGPATKYKFTVKP